MSQKNVQKFRKATTREGRESQLISLAEDLAEKQLRDGTAKPSTINYYLKLGGLREQKEQQLLEKKIDELSAKVESYESTKRMEDKLDAAMLAFGLYSGKNQDDDDEDLY